MNRYASLTFAALGLAASLHAEPLTLDRAIELAMQQNERAAAADQRVAAAEARVSRARAFFFPDLTINGNYTRRRYGSTRIINGEEVTIQSPNALSSTTNLTSTLFDARAFPLYRQARLSRDSVRFDALDTRRILAFETADAFIQTLSLEQVVRAAERRREFARTNLDDARARFEAGLVSSNDVTRAELELATAERELTRSTGSVRTAYLSLGNLLDAEVEGPLVEPSLTGGEAPQAPVNDSILALARERRPDLQADQKAVEALFEFAKEPSKRFIPNLVMNGQFRHTNETGLGGRENDGFVSFLVTWAAFDGGERRADERERLANARAAQLDLEERMRTVETQIRQANVAVESEQASLTQAIAATSAARRNADETLELYRQGLAGSLEVADANTQLFEAEVAEARARYQVSLAYLDYRAAVGEGPLSEVNR